MTQHGTVLGGRYQLDQVIGRGGMAEVWRAMDVRLGREVALKRLRVDLATDPTFQARFRREAQSAAGLNHPNIVSTYDTGEEADQKTGVAVPYIVMELVEGHTLRDLLRADRPIRPEKAFEWTQGVLDALGTSHKAGIIHRDIKPANVMLTPTGQVKVMDFGIARAVADTSATMTQTAAVIGTAQYLSPEQARGETVDNRSDIYSSGCLLYELLCGRPPFTGDSPVSVAYQHVREAPVPPSTLDPELTPAMDAIVLKSLAKDPADRYQTAREMRDDIARLLNGETVQAMVPPVPVVPATTVDPNAATELVPTPSTATSATSAASAASATPVEDPVDEEVVEEDPKKRSLVGWIIALLLLALLALGGISAYVFLRNPTDPDMAAVPQVTGQTEESATQELSTAGFQAKAVHTNLKDTTTIGQVTEQDPNQGQEARKGSTVTITVNDGPQTNKIPTAITGMTEDEARKALTEAGFTAGNISAKTASADQEKEHLDFTKGQVVTSNPAPGADVVPAEQKVVLFLATGKSTMPNLGSLTEEEAKKAAAAAGFKDVTVEKIDVTDQSQDQKVQRQDPTAGQQADRTATVTITIGEYVKPEPVPAPTQTASSASASPSATQSETPAEDLVDVPNVTNQDQAAAKAALEAAGFAVQVNQAETHNQAEQGKVLNQNPAGGQAPWGSTVAIGVGKYVAESTAPSSKPSSTASSAPPAATASKTP
ncbi:MULTISPECIES: Stk1 family PASTA domain-containing Ser/Thr kinase [unclassified Luteococcus]|uniref:Stk1 family PASTA domain-containing Ser/Thr kinase n=1 Tax=unclassified Luteococcus TaxID=2639923 RepID=UPI00313C6A70